jgi:hypothetical protein
MRPALKIVHLIGLALFLGSVFSHVVAAVLGGPPGSSDFLPARAEIVAATRALTLPGLGLAVLSGVGMALVSPGLRRQRWLWLHAGLAVLVALSSLALVAPAGRQALALASGDVGAPGLAAALLLERVGGSVNIVLAIALLAVGVIKPALRARGAARVGAQNGASRIRS